MEKLKPSDFYTYSVIRYGTPQGFYMDLITKFSLDLLIKMKKSASLFREKDKVDLFYLKKLKEFKNIKNITLKNLKRIYRFFKTLDEFTEKVEFPIKPKVFYRGLTYYKSIKDALIDED